jgi:hypothetical protein
MSMNFDENDIKNVSQYWVISFFRIDGEIMEDYDK